MPNNVLNNVLEHPLYIHYDNILKHVFKNLHILN